MIGTKPYEFMVKYTPQRDWIEGHGILIAFALFFGGIAWTRDSNVLQIVLQP